MHEEIKKQRIAQGLSQAELARKTGLSPSVICRVESGKIQPSLPFLKACSIVLSLEVMETKRPRANRSGLSELRPWLRRAFPPGEPALVQCLRMSYKLARYTPLGRKLVDWLDTQKFPAPMWRALKLIAGKLNGPEQMLVLHGMRQFGCIQKAQPHETQFTLPVVYYPGEPNLALFIQGCIFFPQVEVSLDCYNPRIDFLLALPGDRPFFISIEIDGRSHLGSQERDRLRAAKIGLAEIRIPIQDLEREDFWPYLWTLIQESLAKYGLKWSTRLQRTQKL